MAFERFAQVLRHAAVTCLERLRSLLWDLRKEMHMTTLRISGALGAIGAAALGTDALAPASSPPATAGTGGSSSATPNEANPAPAASSAGAARDPGSSTTAAAKAPAAKPSTEAIGMQMVLVFDDQTHSMTVKLLDIETQKVAPPPLSGISSSGASSASASAASSSVSTAAASKLSAADASAADASGPPGSGALVDTTA
jgi:hypothetical protein